MFIPLKTLARLSTHKDTFFLMLNSPIVIYNICEPVIDCNYIKFYFSSYIFTSLAGLMNNATIINLVPDRVSLSTSNFHENSECSFYKRVLQHFPGNVNTVVYKKARHFKLASTTVISCIFGLFFLTVIVRNLVFFISPHKPIPQLHVSTILC